MSTKLESPTTKFKRSTARFVRSELKKTKHSVSYVRGFALRLVIALAIGIGVSFGYVSLIQ